MGVKLLLGLSAISGCLLAEPARADIPTIDFTAIGNQMRQIEQELKAYTLQAKQALSEAQTALSEAQMVAGFIRNPTLGAAMGLMNMAGLGNSLPVNPYAVQGLVNGFNYRTGGIPAVGGILNNLSSLSNSSWSANHVYTPQDGSWRSQQVIASGNGISGVQGAAEAAYQDYRSHLPVMQALRDHLVAANTPKDVMDTQAEIALENLWATNQVGQVGAINIAYMTQHDNQEQREKEQMLQSGQNYLASARAAGVIQ